MKTTKELIKKHDNVFFIILIMIVISGIALIGEIMYKTDEIWNFQNVYKMYNGLQIYKDANVIITPLFFYIGKFLFGVLGANFLTFRIYNIAINTFLYFIIYLIFKEMLNSKLKSLSYTLIIFIGCNTSVRTMSNYTSLAVALFLLGTLLNLKEKGNFILNGIIIFLTFMCKQNVGVYYIIALILRIIFIDKLKRKYIINFAKQIIIFTLLFVVYCIYLYLNHNLYNFISYCFLGINEFKENFGFETCTVIPTIICIITIILLRIALIKNKKNVGEKIKKIECFSIMLLLIGYPIFNEYHLGMGRILIYVELLIIFDKIMLSEIISKRNFLILTSCLLLLLIMISTNHFITYLKYIYSNNYDYKVYYGGILDNEIKEDIKQIIEFKESNNKTTIVFGNKAAFYNIVTNESYGAMDLPFLGNFGAKGENGMIEQLENLKETTILLEKNESDLSYQESLKIRNWIKEHFNLVGEIGRYYIYETE